MKLIVTADDVKGARRNDACSCPVARALGRAGFANPRAYDTHGTFGSGEFFDSSRRLIPFSAELTQQINFFDSGEDFVAGEYEIGEPHACGMKSTK